MEKFEHKVNLKKNRIVQKTTAILKDEDREYLEELIRDGKVTGLKNLIAIMFDIHRDLGMREWNQEGVYYRGISRVALITLEMLESITDMIPKNKLREVGNGVGTVLSTTLMVDKKIDTKKPENIVETLKQVSVLGFGDFTGKDEIIITKNPFLIKVEMLTGFLEGLLGLKLQPKTSSPPIIIQIVK